MKSTSLKTFILTTGILSLAAVSAKAQIVSLYSTTFSSPTYTDAVLNAGTDTTTPGQDGWISTSGTANLITVSNSATNGFVSLTNNGQDVREKFTAVTSGSVWLGADITVSAAQAAGDYFIHLGDGGTANFNDRTFIKSSGAGFVMALGTGSGAVTYGTTVLNFNTTYHLLTRYDINSGTLNDTGALYIDPTTTDGSGDTPYVAATTIGVDATSISSVNLRQGTASSAPTLTVDNISVFTTAAPEPGTAALALIGSAALLMRRRRHA